MRVTLLLDGDTLADLERIVRYRHGPRSRSAVVREAIMWLRAREAAFLVRRAVYEEEQRRRADVDVDVDGVLARERRERDETIRRALDVVRLVDDAAT